MQSTLNYKDSDIKYMFARVPGKLFEIRMNNRLSTMISLSQTLSLRKTVMNILFEI